MLNTLEINHLRRRLRECGYEPFQIKSAELGGGQDAPFETAFSNLAHAYVKDKAPKLLDYEVGFQLIEKNAENTKAVGIFNRHPQPMDVEADLRPLGFKSPKARDIWAAKDLGKIETIYKTRVPGHGVVLLKVSK